MTAALVGSTVVIAGLNRATKDAWDWTLLQNWSLLPHLWAVGGLMFIAWIRRSATFFSLGLLVGLVFVEEAFHVLNAVAGVLDRLGQGVGTVVFYLLVGGVGLLVLVFSYRRASAGERAAVRTLTMLLVAGGLFGSVGTWLSMVDHEDILLWLFVEEIGEAIAYALIGGYVAGLVVLAAHARARERHLARRSLSPRTQEQERAAAVRSASTGAAPDPSTDPRELRPGGFLPVRRAVPKRLSAWLRRRRHQDNPEV